MFIDSRDIRLLAVQGLTLPEIARELGATYPKIYRSVQLLGIEVTPGTRGRRPNPQRMLIPQDIQKRGRGRPPRDMSRVAEMAAAGCFIAEIERETGIPRAAIKRWAFQNNHKFSKIPGRKAGVMDTARAEKMSSMYRQGLTLEKIGETFHVTRERVRQILRKTGVGCDEGGQAKTSRSNDAARKAKQDARYLTRHGLTFDQYKAFMKTGLMKVYRNQENSAKHRGIEWSLNLAQWLDIWQTSGKLEQRGRGKGKYVMSRIKDTGGYAIGNVHIQLATENSLEAVDKWKGKVKANRGVFCLFPGTSRPWLSRYGKKQLGRFATEEEAVACREAYFAETGIKAPGTRFDSLDSHAAQFVCASLSTPHN